MWAIAPLRYGFPIDNNLVEVQGAADVGIVPYCSMNNIGERAHRHLPNVQI